MVGNSTVNTADTLNASGASIGLAINGTTSGVENGQTVTVSIINGSGVTVETFTTTVANNAWSVNVSPTNAHALSDGSYTVTANVSDAAGIAAPPASQNLNVDETPPAPPGLALTTDSGGLNSDHITNNGALTLTGIETGALVQYSTNGGTTWTTSFTPVEGLNTVLVRQTDAVGNVSGVSALSFTLDTIPPAVTFDTVSFTSTGVKGDHITDNGNVTLSGTVSDNVTVSQVQVFNGSQLLGTASVDNIHHTWTLTTTLAPGAYNQFNATAIDEAGNPANATTTQTVQVNDAPVLTPISPTLTAITEDQTSNVSDPGQTVASFIGASISDVDAGAVKGIAITGLTSTNGSWQYSIDGGATWTAVGAVSNSTALLLDASDKIRFLPDGNNGGSDTITYRAWDETTGSHGATADTSANGGTTAFSTATDTAHLTVASLNDAPVLTPISPTLTAITEDQTSNVSDPGQTVASFIGASISDVDAGAVKGIAITGLTSTNGSWQYSIDGGATWTAVGAVSNSTALLLDASDKIRFLPDGNNGGSDTITYRAWDETTGSHGATADTSSNGGTTAFSTATDTAHLTVASLNDAPVLTPISPTLTAITEDQTSNVSDPGQTVASFIGASISDVDAGAVKGIAITGLTSTNGSWQYSIDGGTTWTAVGAVSNSTALLLDASDKIRFLPDGNNGGSDTITYRAWDETTGSHGATADTSANGGTTAFSTATDTAHLTVASLNDAPVLTPISPTLTAITEDQTSNVSDPGQTVASFIGASISDVDAGAVKGIAITGLTSTNGSWQYSIDGGATWTAVGAVSNSTALLLDASDKIRFLPDGNNGGSDTITYRAWDETAGSHGATADTSSNGGTTAFSTATDTAHLTVASLNDAPVLTPISPTLTAITEDQTSNVSDPGQTVSSFIGASISDVDAGAVKGIAITGLTSTNGSWQYSIDGGTTWTAVGAVSNSTALLLDASDKIRFLPDGNNGGSDTITYRAWDETTGSHGATADTSSNGGTTAFSTATDTAHLTVASLNDAPVLTPISPTLTAITEDQTSNVSDPGQTVSSFIGASISDVDAGAVKGIAITGLTSTNGSWQYSIDGGTTWTAVGAVSNSTALLLDASDKIRFLPDGNNGGSDTITYRAWDETTGSHGTTADTSANGGTTAFSTATDTAHLTVASLNDAPVLTPISPTLTAITEDQTSNVSDPGQTVASFIGASISDVDAGAVKGIAITGLTSTNGSWQYSIDGGTTWTAVGAVSNSTALLLDASDKIRFLPDGNNGGSDTITYRAWDETTGSHGATADTSSQWRDHGVLDGDGHGASDSRQPQRRAGIDADQPDADGDHGRSDQQRQRSRADGRVVHRRQHQRRRRRGGEGDCDHRSDLDQRELAVLDRRRHDVDCGGRGEQQHGAAAGCQRQDPVPAGRQQWRQRHHHLSGVGRDHGEPRRHGRYQRQWRDHGVLDGDGHGASDSRQPQRRAGIDADQPDADGDHGRSDQQRQRSRADGRVVHRRQHQRRRRRGGEGDCDHRSDLDQRELAVLDRRRRDVDCGGRGEQQHGAAAGCQRQDPVPAGRQQWRQRHASPIGRGTRPRGATAPRPIPAPMAGPRRSRRRPTRRI